MRGSRPQNQIRKYKNSVPVNERVMKQIVTPNSQAQQAMIDLGIDLIRPPQVITGIVLKKESLITRIIKKVKEVLL